VKTKRAKDLPNEDIDMIGQGTSEYAQFRNKDGSVSIESAL
jgi:hypothetical protein